MPVESVLIEGTVNHSVCLHGIPDGGYQEESFERTCLALLLTYCHILEQLHSVHKQQHSTVTVNKEWYKRYKYSQCASDSVRPLGITML